MIKEMVQDYQQRVEEKEARRKAEQKERRNRAKAEKIAVFLNMLAGDFGRAFADHVTVDCQEVGIDYRLSASFKYETDDKGERIFRISAQPLPRHNSSQWKLETENSQFKPIHRILRSDSDEEGNRDELCQAILDLLRDVESQPC